MQLFCLPQMRLNQLPLDSYTMHNYIRSYVQNQHSSGVVILKGIKERSTNVPTRECLRVEKAERLNWVIGSLCDQHVIMLITRPQQSSDEHDRKSRTSFNQPQKCIYRRNGHRS